MNEKSAAIVPELTLLEARDGRLDPTGLHETGATVRVAYEGMDEGDEIWMFWASRPFGVYEPFGPKHGVEEGFVDFHISPYFLGLRINRFAEFHCLIKRGGEEVKSADALIRVTLPFNDLHAPYIPQAVGDELDLSRLCCKDPEVVVPAWVFIDPIQIVQLRLTATLPDGSNVYRWLVDGERVTEAEALGGWKRPLLLSELMDFPHGSKLFFSFFVAFNGPGDQAYRLFPGKSIKLLTQPHLDLPEPELREAVHTGQAWVVNPVNTVDGAHIVVTYEGMCCGDTVCPTFSGTPGPGSPLLECRQPAEGESSLVFTVPPSAISANFEQDITLKYRVIRCDGSEWFSPSPRTVKVLEISGLPKPVVMEATNGTLNLNHFTGDATATVDRWPYIALGQPCWLWVTGKLEDDTLYRFEVLEGVPVTGEWLTNGVNTPLPRLELEKLADCSDLEVHFAVNFNGRSDKDSATHFRRLELHVTQKDLDLKAATVLEADGSDLTIWNGRYGVTVQVAYARMSHHHTITARWINPNGTVLPLGSKGGDSDRGYVEFTVPREAVIHGAGKTVLIDYTVTSDCKFAPSKTFALKISRPTRLPTPVVEQATPRATQYGILDLTTFPADALITVEPWWFALAGQCVWLKCTGIKKDGTEHTFYVVKGRPLTPEEAQAGLSQTLSRSDLLLLKHDSPLTVTCMAAPDSNEPERSSITFPVLNLIVKRQLICHVERFEGLALGMFAAGGSIQTDLMKITFTSGAGLAGIGTYGNDSYYSGKHFVMCQNSDHQIPPQLHRFDFSRELESVRFSWAWKQRPATVTFYDPAGNMVRQETYPDDWRGGFWVELVTSPGTTVAWMTILVEDYSFIDNFSMCYRE
ncbi:hypothetical protein [Pseudomonas sp. W4I3]|uniref:hypothetical protein n=1 Tax=Pseudomonas sp. W4I3 TaxID=3042294 RepID=UPI0027811D37|nr:hypothetical protein [Pseudomonas sp. W4I3]MDQ0741505.1 hypothetical protein [Pseudomonas sp. W4I3]